MLSPALKTDIQAIVIQITDSKVLSPTSLKRLNNLMSLIDAKGYINYAEAYRQLFPKSEADSKEKEKADKAFSKFRTTLRTETEKHDMPLVLRVDNHKNADSNNRQLWFECEDNIKQRVEAYNDSYIQNLPEIIEKQTISIGDGTFRYLLIYAKKEKDIARQLHNKLRTQLKVSDINWKMLDYYDIPIGEAIQQTRQSFYREANFILLILSSELIAELMEDSTYKNSELKKIPLALKKVTQQQLKAIALDGYSIFTDADSKPWDERKNHKKDEWVAEASDHMISAIQSVAEIHRRKHIITHMESANLTIDAVKEQYFIDPFLQTTSSDNAKDAIPYLTDWLTNRKSEVFCAIFGELGMGKTTLCQQLTRHLLQQRKQNSTLPFPVYFDLRSVNNLNWNWQEQGVPALDIIIENALKHTYNQAVDAAKITVDDIKRLAQEQGGLIIFDGLDEVMNRLTPDQSNHFIQQLWSILPPTVYNAESTSDANQKHGRLIMTCRSHYFQTLQDQLNSLTGQQRETVKQKNYRWVTLLPLNDSQVESYFCQVFAENPEQAARVISMLDKVHNLRELSNRPYNMHLIQQQVDMLEALQRQDKKVTVADLYEGMVGKWLQRDKPKHRLSLEHKLILMESLALLLWRGQKKQIKHPELEDWLTDQLIENKRWQLNYQSYLNQQQGLDILQQDLRNASFLVRHDDDSFRFAHTSIMEFFLARALYRALLENQFQHWTILPPSVETLDFLAELIIRDQADLCLSNMANLRQQYQPLASEVLLHYALRAYQKDYPGAVFTQFDLKGAKLKNLQIKAIADKPLNWMRADFSQTDLRDTKFIGINFSQSCFEGSKLDRSLFDDCCLNNVNGQKASLIGTIFHHCTAKQADFFNAQLYRTQWLPKKPALVTTDEEAPKGLQGQVPQLFMGQLARQNGQTNKRCFKGHNWSVEAVAYAPDGQSLASASYDNTVKLWDAETGECQQTLKGHDRVVTAVAYAPDGQSLASASHDNTVKLWDAETGECHKTLKGHDSWVTGVVYAPDGQKLLSASRDNAVKMWDTETGECQQTLKGHDEEVTAVAYAPNDQSLATASEDKTIKLWDAETGECQQTLRSHDNWVAAVAYAPDGQSLVSASRDNAVKLWDTETGECQQTLKGHDDEVMAVAYAPDGQSLASASGDNTVKLWDAETGECRQTLKGHDVWVASVVYAPNGQTLASAIGDKTVKLWDAETGECRQTLKGHDDGITGVAYALDEQTLASASYDKTVKLWDVETGECLQTLKGHDGWVKGVAYAPDGQSLASASYDMTVKLWDAKTGECQQTLKGHDGGVRTVTYAPDGQSLASASEDNAVKLWDAKTGECQQTLKGHDGGVRMVTYAPDGQSLASASDDNTVKLWDAKTGECQQTLKRHGGWGEGVVYAPDGQTLASASYGKTVKLWDAETGECQQTLKGHDRVVTAVAYAPDGQSLASASWDKTVKLWDAETGECQQTLKGHDRVVTAVTYAPDGLSLVSTSDDGSCIRWISKIFVTSTNNKPKFEAVLKMEILPENNWVSWTNPNRPTIPFAQQHWQHYSKDAWRWLGWNAPSPDGKSITRYPMDYFLDED